MQIYLQYKYLLANTKSTRNKNDIELSVKYEKKKAKINEFLPRKVVDMRNQIENEGDRGSRRK